MSDRPNQLRDTVGRYQSTFDKVCVCGHAQGHHAAVRDRDPATGAPTQPCFAHDVCPGAADNLCDCDCFRKSRRRNPPPPCGCDMLGGR